MKRTLFIVLGLLITSVALAEDGGDSAGNGGDPLVDRFVEAKDRAVQALKYLDAEDLEAALNPEIAKFLIENRVSLAEDILASPQAWIDRDQGRCARTEPKKRQPITLSFINCKNTSPLEAASLLVHEATHHLGIVDEDFAYNVGQALTNTAAATTAYERNHAVLAQFVHAFETDATPIAEQARAARQRYLDCPACPRNGEVWEVVNYRRNIALAMAALGRERGLTVTNVICPKGHTYVPKTPEGGASEYGEHYIGDCKQNEWPYWTVKPRAVTALSSYANYVTPARPGHAEPGSQMSRMRVDACTRWRRADEGELGAPTCSFFDLWSGEVRDEF